jgi:hypothetical protein
MRNNKDYVWAIFLIFLGTILLLNTTGILDWSVWRYILNYWPVFLILAGLRLILGRSLVSTILVSILSIVAFSYIGLCAYSREVENPPAFVQNISKFCTDTTVNIKNLEDVTEDYSVELDEHENMESVKYNIDLGISKFDITDGGDNFLDLNAKFNTEYGEPTIESQDRESELTIDVSEQRADPLSFFNFESPIYSFVFGSELPSEINVKNGVGSGTMLFENQAIEKLKVETGTGDINIKLGYNSIPTEELRVTIGTGDVSLKLPPEVGYSIEYNLGVGTISLDGKDIGGLDKEGEEVKSENYDEAYKVLEISADVGVGLLDINFEN